MKLLRNTKGFSIIEVTVAAVLVGVAVLGTAGFLQSANFKNTSSKAHTAGATLVEKALEQQKAIGYSDVTGGGDTVTVDGLSYTRTWTVAGVTENGVSTDTLKKVEVTVQWGNGADKRIQTAIFLARSK